MNTQRLILLSVAALVNIGVMLWVIQLLLYRLMPKVRSKEVNVSFATWFAALFVSASMIVQKCVMALAEAIDNIYKLFPEKSLLKAIQTASIFTVLGSIWLLVWVSIAGWLLVSVTGRRKDKHEIEIGNIGYFLLKGVFTAGSIYCLLPLFERLLGAFIPDIQLPIYH
jgi:hypothetical protein